MAKSTVKALAMGLLVALSTIGAVVIPRPLAAPQVSKPEIESPKGNALITDATPTLKWTASTPFASLDHYEYQVATDSEFDFLFPGASGNIPAGTEQVTVVPLDRVRTYWWRVRACDNVGPECTAWSTTSFRVSVGRPTPLQPLGPYLFTNRDTFEWTSVTSATGYALQVSRGNDFSSFVINTTTAANVSKFTPASDLPANTVLYWRVRANNNDASYGPGPWSVTTQIITADPPDIPVLEYPQNNGMTIDQSPRLLWTKPTMPAATNFDVYHVQIATNTNFSAAAMAVDDSVTSTTYNDPSYQVPDATLNYATTYYWRVRACNNDGVNPFCSAWSDYFTLHIGLDAPNPLIAPANGVVLTENRPLFQWTPVNKAMNYILELSTRSDFKTVAYRWISPTTSYRPLSPLPPNVKYFWRVRGGHPTYGPGLPSARWSFTTADPPSMPTLKSPASNALVTSIKPALSWTFSATSAATTFAYYHVQIDNNANFGSPEVDSASIINQSAPYFRAASYPAPLNRLTRYYWRVRACNTGPDANPNTADDQCSDWSPSRYFRVAAAAPVNLSSAGSVLDWNDVFGAATYYVEIRRNGVLFMTMKTTISKVNLGKLRSGTYTWRVRVRATFVPGFAPSAWSVTKKFVVP